MYITWLIIAKTMTGHRCRSVYLLSVLIACSFCMTWACVRVISLRRTTPGEPSRRNSMDHLVLHVHNDREWKTPFTDIKRHRILHENDDAYMYSSDSLPNDPRFRPSIANGHLGTVVHYGVVHVNGVYNGYMRHSHRAVIPSTIDVNVTGLEPSQSVNIKYCMDAWEGIFTESLIGTGLEIEHRQFAHRETGPLLVSQIEVRRNTTDEDLKVKLNVAHLDWGNTPDISFSDEEEVQLEPGGAIYRHGQIKEPETNTSGHTPVHVIYDVIPETLVVPRGVGHMLWTFLTSIHVTHSAALQAYNTGKSLLYNNGLLDSHVTAWDSLWNNGRIDMEGDSFLAKMTSSSLYYILSSIPLKDDPEWPYIGLSPNGLPWGAKDVDYWGHVFWDQDTWMFPPVLLLHQPLAATLLAGRERTMDQARRNALLNGHEGLQYPWESAFSGVEVTPGEKYAQQEIHISGDIALAALQYMRATGDVIDSKPALADVITGVAEFWISKMTLNATSDKYEINGVMGPDEYHWGVNNSVYTNVVAKLTLEAAAQIPSAPPLQREMYRLFAKNIYVPCDQAKDFHPEYDGYTKGTKVKQADVVLLGYPLMYNMTEEQRRNDLEIYENVTDPLGPAMTWCMHAIGWLELGQLERAYNNLKKTFDNVASKFMVWTEVPGGLEAPNFITGQGGFLQAILNGYCGIRLREHQLEVNCVLPLNITRMTITGLDYLGNSIDITCTEEHLVIRVRACEPTNHKLCAMSRGQLYRLWLKSPVTIPRAETIIAERTYLGC